MYIVLDLLKSLGFLFEKARPDNDPLLAKLDRKTRTKVILFDEYTYTYNHIFTHVLDHVDDGDSPSTHAELLASYIEEKEKKYAPSIFTSGRKKRYDMISSSSKPLLSLSGFTLCFLIALLLSQ
jgi:hypothetical protein